MKSFFDNLRNKFKKSGSSAIIAIAMLLIVSVAPLAVENITTPDGDNVTLQVNWNASGG